MLAEKETSIVTHAVKPPIRLSCEFFPVATAEGSRKLARVRDALEILDCDYYSVTYGAGGSTRARTMALVRELCDEGGRAVMPHLTCVATEKPAIEALLDQYHALGIRHLMALRGDMPSGLYRVGDLQNALDLVMLVREKWGEEAHIVVAAYPEIHPCADAPASDLRHFAEKCAAGADEAVTQYFFNPDAYLRFRDEAHALGVTIPIVPGIMPITNYTQLARFSDSCGAEIPRWIRKRIEAYREDLDALRDFGADVVAGLCAHLVAAEAPALHFYTMNRCEAILDVTRRLGWHC